MNIHCNLGISIFSYFRQMTLSQLYFWASIRSVGSMVPPRRPLKWQEFLYSAFDSIFMIKEIRPSVSVSCLFRVEQIMKFDKHRWHIEIVSKQSIENSRIWLKSETAMPLSQPGQIRVFSTRSTRDTSLIYLLLINVYS